MERRGDDGTDAPRGAGDEHGLAGERRRARDSWCAVRLHDRGTISRPARAAMLTGAPPPPLTAEESAQRGRVVAALRSRIDAGGGWIPFRKFMETALYAPGLGYYVTPRAIFGADGDFVTAPELSPLFAACLANGVADLLAKSGGGDVVEFGAGSGALAAGLWPALRRLGAPVARYRIVEPSAALAARQRERVARAIRDSRRSATGSSGSRQPPQEAVAGRRDRKRSRRCAAGRSFPRGRRELRSARRDRSPARVLPWRRGPPTRRSRRPSSRCSARCRRRCPRDSCPSCGPASATGSRPARAR